MLCEKVKLKGIILLSHKPAMTEPPRRLATLDIAQSWCGTLTQVAIVPFIMRYADLFDNTEFISISAASDGLLGVGTEACPLPPEDPIAGLS